MYRVRCPAFVRWACLWNGAFSTCACALSNMEAYLEEVSESDLGITGGSDRRPPHVAGREDERVQRSKEGRLSLSLGEERETFGKRTYFPACPGGAGPWSTRSVRRSLCWPRARPALCSATDCAIPSDRVSTTCGKAAISPSFLEPTSNQSAWTETASSGATSLPMAE